MDILLQTWKMNGARVLKKNRTHSALVGVADAALTEHDGSVGDLVDCKSQ